MKRTAGVTWHNLRIELRKQARFFRDYRDRIYLLFPWNRVSVHPLPASREPIRAAKLVVRIRKSFTQYSRHS